MEFQECSTSKTKRCIVFYEYKYCFKKKNKDTTYWTCRCNGNDKQCSASITTSGDQVVKINGKTATTANVDIVKQSHTDIDHKLYSDEVVQVTNSVADMKIRVKAGESVKDVYTKAQNKFLLETGDPEVTAGCFCIRYGY